MSGTEPEQQYWWSLVHQQVEQGPGTANAERLGPYDTYEEAATAVQRAKDRSRAWDAEDDKWDNG